MDRDYALHKVLCHIKNLHTGPTSDQLPMTRQNVLRFEVRNVLRRKLREPAQVGPLRVVARDRPLLCVFSVHAGAVDHAPLCGLVPRAYL